MYQVDILLRAIYPILNKFEPESYSQKMKYLISLNWCSIFIFTYLYSYFIKVFFAHSPIEYE